MTWLVTSVHNQQRICSVHYSTKRSTSRRSKVHISVSVPRHNLSFGSRAFRISAPKIWNSLPPHILQSLTLDSFRRHLKTYYFQSAYPAHSGHPQCALILFWDFGLYKSLTYLLTFRRSGGSGFRKVSVTSFDRRRCGFFCDFVVHKRLPYLFTCMLTYLLTIKKICAKYLH